MTLGLHTELRASTVLDAGALPVLFKSGGSLTTRGAAGGCLKESVSEPGPQRRQWNCVGEGPRNRNALNTPPCEFAVWPGLNCVAQTDRLGPLLSKLSSLARRYRSLNMENYKAARSVL